MPHRVWGPSVYKVQIAAVVPKPGAPIEIREDYPVKQPDELLPGECLIKMHCSGVCHTDLHVKKDDWPISGVTPLIGGHEGIGDRVGVKWLAYSCLQCEFCRKGLEQDCVKAKNSGFSVDGTFSEYVVSWVNHVTPIPEGFPSADAASILCAGVTVYRAIKHSQTEQGDWIVLPGAGGGLGHLAVQYAVARGLRVIAVDKKNLVFSLGAEAWIDFKETQDLVADIKRITGGLGAHSAVVTTAAPSGYAQAIDYLRPGGTLMAVGLPGAAKLEGSIFFTVLKSISIIGSYVG
ncbi:mannitol-1-phosphate dehydrogenase [Thelephora ganbajun]|uniref:Mannitol-1-phosphate dehydrogenase n=1 Tax=Thelephora ganbajun TaxID=370292 RepID=A0ACB6ZI45_THEGA|nr:mannitol-1-phosphate dehydrogenase [Thelephora ganbajun]